MSFEILFVCTGNICRSAMAQRLAEHRLRHGVDVTVRSAGTEGLTGWAMDAPSAAVLRDLGVDADGHAARLLDEAMVVQADLILTATVHHRDSVLVLDPAAQPRTFTMKEFAALGTGFEGPVGDLTDRVAEIASRRARTGSRRAGELNIADPYGGGRAVARACAAEVSVVVDGDLAALGLGRSG
jgi:protein-tyrosine phosphatase